jgi:5'-deoxynucleotidase YfbR-like HD superfamily hydrolase
MSWIQTYGGTQFDFREPTPDMIDIYTIARVLSRIQRFGGHLRIGYTVAEHSVWVAHHCDYVWALEGLMHDAAEAYIGDIVRDLKKMLPEIAFIEGKIQAAIWQKFGLVESPEMWQHIKYWDNAAVAAEGRDLFTHPPIDNWHLRYPQVKETIVPLHTEAEAYELFLDTFYELQEARQKHGIAQAG